MAERSETTPHLDIATEERPQALGPSISEYMQMMTDTPEIDLSTEDYSNGPVEFEADNGLTAHVCGPVENTDYYYGRVGGAAYIWTACGTSVGGPYRLSRRKPKRLPGWLNVYRDSYGCEFLGRICETREDADQRASLSGLLRIACIDLSKHTEGEGL